MSAKVVMSLCLAHLTAAAVIGVEPDPDRGLYAIWARDSQVAGLEFVHGGQVVMQWRSLQTGPDAYDFTKLDAALRKQSETGRPATVQVNGNLKPEFLYGAVPSIAEKLSVQIRDNRGSLMYWHPNHARAYLDFVAAFGKHIRQSPYRKAVLGVRLNFNALGTEHSWVEKEYQQASRWQCPDGVPPGPDWSRAIMQDYRQKVVAAFIRAFRPDIRVFVRNNVVQDDQLDSSVIKLFETGQLALFHTSSEVQPRSQGTERQYRAFLRWARTGKTTAYAESWADAWGRHGGKRDERWCSPCQWNYWRLLVDLHCGVSFIAVYGADLQAAKGEPEFREALEFAARYAGYHASPSRAPGAWVALREGEYLKGDYSFLMRRLTDDSRPVKLVGPADQRYGAWARQTGESGTMKFHVDPEFLAAHDGKSLMLRVVYLDDGEGQFDVMTRQWKHAIKLSNSGKWQVAQWPIRVTDIPQEAAAHITTEAQKPGLTLHMVELTTAE